MLGSNFKKIEGETNLLFSVSNGDALAFEHIFKHYSVSLFNYSFQMLDDKALAEDLVQDVFVNIWLNREKLLEIKSFKDYLFILSKNRIINELKKRAKLYINSCSVDDIDNDIEEDGVKEIEFKRYKEQIYNLLDFEIDKLPEQQQKILKLAKIEKRSYQQIAELLNISIETVRKHLFLANKTLRKNMEGKNTEIILIILFSKFF